MRPRLSTRMYTNCILSAIAVLLLLLTLHAYRVNIASPAFAQDEEEPSLKSTRIGRSSFGQTGVSSAPVDTGNTAMTQDVAVAAATSEVAAANRDIAAALREVADAIREAGGMVASAKEETRPAGSGVAPAAGAAAPRASSSDSMVEVGPSTSAR